MHLAEGVYVALATPRRPNSTEADTAALLDYADAIIAAGVQGIVLFGSTGEFVHFDVTDRMHVFALAVRRSRVPVLVNVSHSTLNGAVALAESAVEAGAAGLLVMPPYFYRYNDDEIERFFLDFADAVGRQTALYLYNLPFYTNPISAPLATKLLSSGRFAGIKDSSGDWGLFQTLNALRPAHPFRLLVGSESLFLRGRKAGADGIISGVAAAVPELLVAIDGAFRANDLNRANSLNLHLEEFVSWIGKLPSTVGIKQAAVSRGWRQDHLAFPLPDGDLAELDRFRAWFGAWLPIVLRECAHNG